MNTNKFVALNILSENNVVLNPYQAPSIFYWDGKSPIIDELSKQSQFKVFLEKLNILVDPNDYFTSKISYLYYDGENYGFDTVLIKDIFKLNESELVIDNIIKYALSSLYVIAFKNDSPDFNIISIKSVYDNIINKYNNKVLQTTIKNYIRSLVFEKYKLSSDSLNIVMDKLEEKIL